MSRLRSLLLASTCALALGAGGCSTTSNVSQRHPLPGDITVSSADYVASPPDKIVAAIQAPDTINPPAPAAAASPKVRFYLLSPGEIANIGMPVDELMTRVGDALAPTCYRPAIIEEHAGRNPEKRIDVVIRVHAGERPWRDPVVRTANLAWSEGLVGKPAFQSPDASGKAAVWDYRAGGSDLALAVIEASMGRTAAPSFGGGIQMGGGSTPPSKAGGAVSGFGAGASGGSQLSGIDPSGPIAQVIAAQGLPSRNDPSNPFSSLDSDLGSLPTREFYLIVIEGYDFAELQAKQGEARRLWTTFIAMPKPENRTFAQALPAMLRVGVPYIGTTTPSLMVFNGARVN
jgi:hypothetical protein